MARYITVGSLLEAPNRIIKSSSVKDKSKIFKGTTGADLQKAIDTANSGEIIYIEENITVNVDDLGTNSIIINKAITIASNRGEKKGNNYSYGAVIKRGNIKGAKPLFLIKKGAGKVKISGLRLIGSQSIDWGQICIRIESQDKVSVEGCEIKNWSAKAIELYPDPKIFVQKHLVVACNYIHHIHNLEDPGSGTGYGVSVVTSEAMIFGNYFHSNRHDISGSGLPNCAYEAYRNIFGPERKSHTIDMHGIKDWGSPGEIAFWKQHFGEDGYKKYKEYNVAGKYLSLHHNTFKTGGTRDDIRIRGCLSNRYNIWDNRFRKDPRKKVKCKTPNNSRWSKNSRGDLDFKVNIRDIKFGAKTHNFASGKYEFKWNM